MTRPKASPSPATKAGIEEGTAFSPRFDANGLVPVVVTSAATGEVLMLAYMNDEALARTIETGEAQFWSRSRKRLWRKGEESGNTMRVVELRTDCDQDAESRALRYGGRLPYGPQVLLLSCPAHRQGNGCRRCPYLCRKRDAVRSRESVRTRIRRKENLKDSRLVW